MTSSVPKPPQRIRVEMPAEIAPQPVPETLLTTNPETAEKAISAEKPVSNKIHVIHPKKIEDEPKPPVEQLETEAALAVSADIAAPADEPVAAESDHQSVTEEQKETLELTVENELANASPTTLSVPPDEELFQKQYYTIGEVADMFGANQSQIRFWENEFDILQPKKNKKGDRLFRPEDVKNLVLIRHLLQERRFTIEGAKEHLKGKAKRLADRHQAVQQLEKLRGFLLEMKANLGEAAV